MVNLVKTSGVTAKRSKVMESGTLLNGASLKSLTCRENQFMSEKGADAKGKRMQGAKLLLIGAVSKVPQSIFFHKKSCLFDKKIVSLYLIIKDIRYGKSCF